MTSSTLAILNVADDDPGWLTASVLNAFRHLGLALPESPLVRTRMALDYLQEFKYEHPQHQQELIHRWMHGLVRDGKKYQADLFRFHSSWMKQFRATKKRCDSLGTLHYLTDEQSAIWHYVTGAFLSTICGHEDVCDRAGKEATDYILFVLGPQEIEAWVCDPLGQRNQFLKDYNVLFKGEFAGEWPFEEEAPSGDPGEELDGSGDREEDGPGLGAVPPGTEENVEEEMDPIPDNNQRDECVVDVPASNQFPVELAPTPTGEDDTLDRVVPPVENKGKELEAESRSASPASHRVPIKESEKADHEPESGLTSIPTLSAEEYDKSGEVEADEVPLMVDESEAKNVSRLVEEYMAEEASHVLDTATETSVANFDKPEETKGIDDEPRSGLLAAMPPSSPLLTEESKANIVDKEPGLEPDLVPLSVEGCDKADEVEADKVLPILDQLDESDNRNVSRLVEDYLAQEAAHAATEASVAIFDQLEETKEKGLVVSNELSIEKYMAGEVLPVPSTALLPPKARRSSTTTERCPVCRKILLSSDDCIEYNGLKMRRSCFSCRACNTNLEELASNNPDSIQQFTILGKVKFQCSTCTAVYDKAQTFAKEAGKRVLIGEEEFGDTKKVRREIGDDLEQAVYFMTPRCFVCGGDFGTDPKKAQFRCEGRTLFHPVCYDTGQPSKDTPKPAVKLPSSFCAQYLPQQIILKLSPARGKALTTLYFVWKNRDQEAVAIRQADEDVVTAPFELDEEAPANPNSRSSTKAVVPLPDMFPELQLGLVTGIEVAPRHPRMPEAVAIASNQLRAQLGYLKFGLEYRLALTIPVVSAGTTTTPGLEGKLLDLLGASLTVTIQDKDR